MLRMKAAGFKKQPWATSSASVAAILKRSGLDRLEVLLLELIITPYTGTRRDQG